MRPELLVLLLVVVVALGAAVAFAVALVLVVTDREFTQTPWRIAARPWQWLRAACSVEMTAVLVFGLVAAVFYSWAGPDQHDTDGWFPLADSLLHGRLWIDGSRPWIEVAAAGPGQWYLPFPPVPAVVLMPIVALFGTEWIDTSGVTGFVGGINVVLIWIMMRRLNLRRRDAAWLTVAFAFGSEAMYVFATGGIHHWVQALGLMFALAALILAVRHQAPLMAGVLLLAAAGCRPTYLLATPAYLWLYMDSAALVRSTLAMGFALRKFVVSIWHEWGVRLAWFMVGAVPVGLLLLAYNAARFGTPFEFGYDRIVSMKDGSSVLSESWYQNGIVSLTYLPRGLYTMLFRGFGFSEQFPWLQPSWAGTSVLMTTPVLFYLSREPPWV